MAKQSVSAFRRWLVSKVKELSEMAAMEPDDQLWEHAGGIVEEAAERAALLGLTVIYDAHIKVRRRFTSHTAVRFLSECLTALPARTNVTVALTPPQVAVRYGVSPDTVRRWIESGQLRAVNIASLKAKRLRYRIEPEALAEFDKQRAAHVRPEQPTGRRRKKSKLLVTRYT